MMAGKPAAAHRDDGKDLVGDWRAVFLRQTEPQPVGKRHCVGQQPAKPAQARFFDVFWLQTIAF